jgi:membrane glycosyltransferase
MVGNTAKPWEKTGGRRRLMLLVLVLVPTIYAGAYMATVLPNRGAPWLEAVVAFIFSVLFGWLSFGFWIAVLGFFVLWRRGDRFTVRLDRDASPDLQNVRTAILMPIYNEDITRVAAGLETIYRSLADAGQLPGFDFYILSDTNDPDKWVLEELAWADLCLKLDGFHRIFYRNRKPNLKHKSGNIADFCRRWGSRYRYMIVLDADSIMSGKTIAAMVHTMEMRPDIGILQTIPRAVNRETLIARLQQFANHVYGPILAAGLHFWQLGDAQYWGHNAVIRIEPFMKHCGLPQLSGKPPLGGAILSHDFVESALMRRAGWGIWLAYDLPGSYEEAPPTLIDELQRDRRWCQGNLQHLRLLFAAGLFPVHRAVFLNGALTYISALLWFIFLTMSTAMAIWEKIAQPNYFPHPRGLFPASPVFPSWPIFSGWHWQWAFISLTLTLIMLFLPKVLGLIWVFRRERSVSLYGGRLKVCLSVVMESLLSTLLAPVRMLFHSKFVVLTLMGRKIRWDAQSRDDHGTSWREAFNAHGIATIIALSVGLAVYLINPPFTLWLSPALLSLILAPALSVWTSRKSVGLGLKKVGLLLIPAEVAPSAELKRLRTLQSRSRQPSTIAPFESLQGFVRAVVDPITHDLHLSFLRRQRSLSPGVTLRRRGFAKRALALGPQALSAGEKMQLLKDPAELTQLHREVWEIDDLQKAALWGMA